MYARYRVPMRTLTDRVAVVTGAGSGIGRAVAAALSREGCRVALVDVNEEGLAATAGLLDTQHSVHVVDVSDPEAMRGLPARVEAELGLAQILVNNAGITVEGTFLEQTVEDFEAVLGVNFWGVYYGCKFFLPQLQRADEAHIVNVSSIFGVIGVPAQSSYCASKFAVRGLSEALWEELGQTSIGLTLVHPGGVRTNIVAGSKSYDAQSKAISTDFFRRKAMSPNTAARNIVGAIKADKRRLLVAPEAPLFDLLKRLFPVWGNRLAVWIIVRTLGLTDRAQARLEATKAAMDAARAE